MKIKIFYKADYEFMKEENAKLNGQLRDSNHAKNILTIDNKKLKEQVEKLTYDLERCIDSRSDLEFKLLEKNCKLKEISCSKGGLVKKLNESKKEITRLTEELNATKKQLEESMTDKYIVRKVKPGRKPKTLKSASIKSVKGSVQKYQQKLERMEV